MSDDGKFESTNNKVVWLEIGKITNPVTKDGDGWVHIKAKHGVHKPFAGKSDEEIQSIIFDTIKNPTKIKQVADKKGGKCYYKIVEDKIVKTVVASNGFIVTSYVTSKSIDEDPC